jgi:hypothetical protein
LPNFKAIIPETILKQNEQDHPNEIQVARIAYPDPSISHGFFTAGKESKSTQNKQRATTERKKSRKAIYAGKERSQKEAVKRDTSHDEKKPQRIKKEYPDESPRREKVQINAFAIWFI